MTSRHDDGPHEEGRPRQRAAKRIDFDQNSPAAPVREELRRLRAGRARGHRSFGEVPRPRRVRFVELDEAQRVALWRTQVVRYAARYIFDGHEPRDVAERLALSSAQMTAAAALARFWHRQQQAAEDG